MTVPPENQTAATKLKIRNQKAYIYFLLPSLSFTLMVRMWEYLNFHSSLRFKTVRLAPHDISRSSLFRGRESCLLGRGRFFLLLLLLLLLLSPSFSLFWVNMSVKPEVLKSTSLVVRDERLGSEIRARSSHASRFEKSGV